MKKFPRKLAATVLCVALAASIYNIVQASLLRARASRLDRAQTLLAAQIGRATRERDEAAASLAALRRENAQLDRDTPEVLRLRATSGMLSEEKRREARDPDTLGAQAWFAKANLLKERFARWPKPTPELQLLNEQDYLKKAAQSNLESDPSLRRALSDLRNDAKARFGVAVSQAAERFAADNNGQFPTDPYQLAPYLQPPMDSFLDHYEIARPGSVWWNGQPTWAVVEKGSFTAGGTALRDGSNHADPEYDQYMTIYPSGPASTTRRRPPPTHESLVNTTRGRQARS